MKLNTSQVSALIVFTVSLILFMLKYPEVGFIGLIVGGLFLLPK